MVTMIITYDCFSGFCLISIYLCCVCKDGCTLFDRVSEGVHFEVIRLLEYYMTRSAKWRRRRVCVWLSSQFSGGDNILFVLPTDVARICGSYL